MIVQILSCGVNWWGMHSGKVEDPYRFKRHSAYFNSTGLIYGRRLRSCQIYPGHLRFNRTSGLDPEFVDRIVGKIFETAPPARHDGKTRLLFQFPASDQNPNAYLVTLRAEVHGAIHFHRKCWRSPGLQPIAVSKQHERYEAMLLMALGQWVMTDRGRWEISSATSQLELIPEKQGDAI